MATKRTTVPIRKPAQQYPIRRVLTANVVTGEVFSVPGLLFTLGDVQECVDGREASGTVQLYCETCLESVADCIELAPKLRGVPAQWSWQFPTDDMPA
jgi:hypothetical protein